MSQRRVCDACSVRRVKCDGQTPCAACVRATIECTRLRPRQKAGPKGIRQKTIDKVIQARQKHSQARQVNSQYAQASNATFPDGDQRWVDDATFGPPSNSTGQDVQDQQPFIATDAAWEPFLPQPPLGGLNGRDDEMMQHPSIDTNQEMDPGSGYPHRVPLSSLVPYLEIYDHKLYPVWPIVERGSLAARLEQCHPDADAYMLALSVCAATILQLQLAVTNVGIDYLEPKSMIMEVESLRQIHSYRENPTLDAMSTSFFLHVAYLLIGKRTTSTLLLREAISNAHMLGLHRREHYESLAPWTVQEHLRKLWLLFITESVLTASRAHATQYDLPCILTIAHTLPALDNAGHSSTISSFTILCKMFAQLHEAPTGDKHTVQSLTAVHDHLRAIPALTHCDNELQQADLSVTQQWLRLLLWKQSMSHFKLVMDPQAGIQSILFPVQLARDLLTNISGFSNDALEAHGPGMELKLFEVTETMLNVMECMPDKVTESTPFGPPNLLVHLARILGDFRGGNHALLPILQSRIADVGLSVPAVPRLIDITDEPTSSHHTPSTIESNEALVGSIEDEYMISSPNLPFV